MFETYKSKPSTVEAVLITEENIESVAKLINGEVCRVHDSVSDTEIAFIEFNNNLHNLTLAVRVGQYLCKASDIDLYPCHINVFTDRYYNAKEDIAGISELNEITQKTIKDLTEEAEKKFSSARSLAITMARSKNDTTELQFLELAKVPMSIGFVNGYLNALTAYKIVNLGKN